MVANFTFSLARCPSWESENCLPQCIVLFTTLHCHAFEFIIFFSHDSCTAFDIVCRKRIHCILRYPSGKIIPFLIFQRSMPRTQFHMPLLVTCYRLQLKEQREHICGEHDGDGRDGEKSLERVRRYWA